MTRAALDIGGANIKGARGDGLAVTRPFALWKHPEKLADAVERVLGSLMPCDHLAVTMTGELCDCYSTRDEGVLHILQSVVEAVQRVSATTDVGVWLIDGRLVPVSEASSAPRLAAAANWLALATWAASLAGEEDGVLIDIGSTTSDIVILRGGKPRPQGYTDTERLQTGELVYTGVRRTPIPALLQEVTYRQKRCRLASELFATTLDVYQILNEIPEDPANHDTADGREATRKCAHARLSRVVCANPQDFGREDASSLAEQAARAQLDLLVKALCEVTEQSQTVPATAILAGTGEFLARQLAAAVEIPRIQSLTELAGTACSKAACAFALARIGMDGV